MKNKFLFLFIIIFSPLFVTKSYGFNDNYNDNYDEYEYEYDEDGNESRGLFGFIKRHKILSAFIATAGVAGVMIYTNQNMQTAFLSYLAGIKNYFNGATDVTLPNNQNKEKDKGDTEDPSGHDQKNPDHIEKDHVQTEGEAFVPKKDPVDQFKDGITFHDQIDKKLICSYEAVQGSLNGNNTGQGNFDNVAQTIDYLDGHSDYYKEVLQSTSSNLSDNLQKVMNCATELDRAYQKAIKDKNLMTDKAKLDYYTLYLKPILEKTKKAIMEARSDIHDQILKFEVTEKRTYYFGVPKPLPRDIGPIISSLAGLGLYCFGGALKDFVVGFFINKIV